MVDPKVSLKDGGGTAWLLDISVGVLCIILGLMVWRALAPGSPEVLPTGTAVTIQLKHPINSLETHLGDSFEAWVVSTQAPNGRVAIPSGAKVEGRCLAVRPGEGEGRPGYLRLGLSGLWDDKGHFSPLETTTISLPGRWPVDLPQRSVSGEMATTANARRADPVSRADYEVNPQASLTFVLLKPVVLSGGLSAP